MAQKCIIFGAFQCTGSSNLNLMDNLIENKFLRSQRNNKKALDNWAQRHLSNDHPGLPYLVLRDFTSVVGNEEDNLTELKAKTEELIRKFARASDGS